MTSLTEKTIDEFADGHSKKQLKMSNILNDQDLLAYTVKFFFFFFLFKNHVGHSPRENPEYTPCYYQKNFLQSKMIFFTIVSDVGTNSRGYYSSILFHRKLII